MLESIKEEQYVMLNDIIIDIFNNLGTLHKMSN